VVTSTTNDIAHWPVASRAAGEEHCGRAETALTKWRSATADEAFANAALWLHFATCVPGADRAASAELLNQAAVAHRRARWRWSCRHRPSNTSVRIERVGFFAAILERPNPQSSGDTTPTPVATVAPGTDSSKEEFARVADSLRRRGLATTRIDGPGQGEMLDADRVTATGLSVGRYYVPRAAAFEPRIKATVTDTGPYAFGESDNLPPMIQEIVVLRTGDAATALEFTSSIDLASVRHSIQHPFLVVAGGRDPVASVADARRLAGEAPRAQLLEIAEGDHLCANCRWEWQARAGDWLADAL
jgi:hypothetical protein